jgi:asparagine synthase (glutamine-hydrolysing)
MCGIVGTIGLSNRDVISTMNGAIMHRGPNDQGVFFDEDNLVALGHRRLSIIDLSSAGRQPMSYLDGRFWAVYNGEVYNFKEIRKKLKKKRYAFHSDTDTEVLLAAYAEWGEDCLRRLRGMFAFAIYDREQASIFLARDRFGIKPLYFSDQDDFLLFASEIKALLASGYISRRVDKQSIWDYLSLGSIPQPRTILADVKTLLPGHAMTVSASGEYKVSRYWDIAAASSRSFPNAHKMDNKEVTDKLRRLLEDATRLHMIADVPVGAFLSGGIDSSAVVGLMSQYVSEPIKTYSVGFESKYARLSELKWARIASECFNTDHSEIIITGEDVAREYDQLIQAIDQPSIDGTNSYFVSKAARKGVTVALSGLGGDELFAGYPHFQKFKQAAQWDKLCLPLNKKWMRKLVKKIPRHWRPDGDFLTADPSLRHAAIRCLADEKRKHHMTNDSFRAKFYERPLSAFYQHFLEKDLDAVLQMSYIELNGYLPNTLLRDVDAVSMAHALEVRPILLDHVFAEFAFALPAAFKLNGKTTKFSLVDAVQDLLPEPIMQRPKMGFELPLFDWLSGPLKSRAFAALSSSIASAIFTPYYLTKFKSILEGDGRSDRGLWGYVMLLEWLRTYDCEV